MIENDLINYFYKRKRPKKYDQYFWNISKGKVFFTWNKKIDYNWEGIFNPIIPISYLADGKKFRARNDSGIPYSIFKINYQQGSDSYLKMSNGYLKPKFNLVSAQVDYDRYHLILSKLGLKVGQDVSLSLIPAITAYRDLLLTQMDRQTPKLVNLASEILEVIKVYYYETEKASSDGFNDYLSEGKRIFKFLQSAMTAEEFHDSWIIEAINSNPHIDKNIKVSTIYGVSSYLEMYQPVIEASNKIAKDIYVIESIIEDYIHDGNISKYHNFQEKIQGYTTADLIEIAIDGRNVKRENKDHAREFLTAYAKLIIKSPGLNIQNYIDEIGFTQVSDETYRTWIDKFIKEKRELNKS